MNLGIGTRVIAHYTIALMDQKTGALTREPGPGDGKTGKIVGIMGAIPTYRIEFDEPRIKDAFLGADSLEPQNDA